MASKLEWDLSSIRLSADWRGDRIDDVLNLQFPVTCNWRSWAATAAHQMVIYGCRCQEIDAWNAPGYWCDMSPSQLNSLRPVIKTHSMSAARDVIRLLRLIFLEILTFWRNDQPGMYVPFDPFGPSACFMCQQSIFAVFTSWKEAPVGSTSSPPSDDITAFTRAQGPCCRSAEVMPFEERDTKRFESLIPAVFCLLLLSAVDVAL